ncbi:MAG: hypothetical protein WD270_13575 [Acetobacterales bacterium]
MARWKWAGLDDAAHAEPEPRPSEPSWLEGVSIEDLYLLRALATLRPSEAAGLPPWADALVERIRGDAAERTDTVERGHAPAPVDPLHAIWESDDLAAAVEAHWPTLRPETRAALRTLAPVLGVELPADP